MSILPVLLVSFICCHYEQPELLLGLFLVEWIVVLVAWRLLCPWLGRRSVVMAAVPFLLSFGVAAIVLREVIAVYGTVWTGSDDWWYLQEAGRVVDSLRSSGWNLSEAWSELSSTWEGAAWTLAGWPFVLGLVSSFVTSNSSPEMLHAIALSLNATFLTLVLALVYHVLGEAAQRFPCMVLVCFLLLIGDPIVYTSQCRKESMLQLSLMLSFVLCMKLSKRLQVRWIIFGLIGMIGVATTRPPYILLILLVLYLRVWDRIRWGAFLKVVLGFIIIASFGGMFLEFQIREFSIAEMAFSGQAFFRILEVEPGLALSIYNIPLVGPVFYYAISPVPPLPWKILSQEQIITTLIRGAGSVAWFFAACYVLNGIVRNLALLKDRLFVTATIMFIGLFIATVLIADDPRYKQPTNFYLAIMLFLTWYDR
jgi:hypothetical protein